MAELAKTAISAKNSRTHQNRHYNMKTAMSTKIGIDALNACYIANFSSVSWLMLLQNKIRCCV
jgi:hypothetical protein